MTEFEVSHNNSNFGSSENKSLKKENIPKFFASEQIPVHSWVIKTPKLSLRHLAQRGVKEAKIRADTCKSIKPFATPQEYDELSEKQEKIGRRVREKPFLGSATRCRVISKLYLTFSNRSRNDDVPQPVGIDVQKLQSELDEFGISDLPMRTFVIPLDGQNMGEWITFQIGGGGFYSTYVGDKKITEFTPEQLLEIVGKNPILENLGGSVCQLVRTLEPCWNCRVLEKDRS